MSGPDILIGIDFAAKPPLSAICAGKEAKDGTITIIEMKQGQWGSSALKGLVTRMCKKHRISARKKGSQPMTHLPVLTIKQPWAALHAAGSDTIINRSYAPPRTIRGKRIGIHAGLSWDDDCSPEALLQFIGLESSALKEARGAILATAVVAGCLEGTMKDRDRTFYWSDAYTPGNRGVTPLSVDYTWWDTSCFGWVLRGIRLLPTLIPAKGQQGIWYFDVEEEALNVSK